MLFSIEIVQFKMAVVIFSVLINTDIIKTAPALNSKSENSNSVLDQVAGLANSAVDLKANLLTPIEKSRENVKLESEGLPSRILSIYDDKQQQTAKTGNRIPIVDAVSEQDKKGNQGDRFSTLGRAIVNGYEAFANLINKLFDKPEEVAKTISRGITGQLDNIGARFVGLA